MSTLNTRLCSVHVLRTTGKQTTTIGFRFSVFRHCNSGNVTTLRQMLCTTHRVNVVAVISYLRKNLPAAISTFTSICFGPESPLLTSTVALLPCCNTHSLNNIVGSTLGGNQNMFVTSLASGRRNTDLRATVHRTNRCGNEAITCNVTDATRGFGGNGSNVNSMNLVVNTAVNR